MAMKNYLDENIASPVGVWLRDGKLVYRLKERTGSRDYHNGQRLRENEVAISVQADDETKAINLAARIHELLAGK